MKLINRENLIDASSLQAEPETDIKELLKPTAVDFIDVSPYLEDGIAQLAVALVDPPLKLIDSVHKWTICEDGKYAIAETVGDEVIVDQWKLTDEASVEHLKSQLRSGKSLIKIRGDRYTTLAREKDIPNLVIEKNYEELWHNVCRAYLEFHVLSLVRWSYQSRRQPILDTFIKDVALTHTNTNGGVKETSLVTGDDYFSASNYVMETLPGILEIPMREVSDFVRSDLWAYYSLSTDARGIVLSRHRDARALMWNNHFTDQAAMRELEDEALSAWAIQ